MVRHLRIATEEMLALMGELLALIGQAGMDIPALEAPRKG